MSKESALTFSENSALFSEIGAYTALNLKRAPATLNEVLLSPSLPSFNETAPVSDEILFPEYSTSFIFADIFTLRFLGIITTPVGADTL
ncbi:hypothetical protein SDC9_71929 [bioreactor metagenome]|uniref:Uncharacterized protein n=1 Tax=bioreactor metagenome TaxID=1076179 RepID=A0A644YA69_9ZZZZ